MCTHNQELSFDCEDCRERYELKNKVETLEAALRQSMVAIDDWLNLFAPDFCDEARVAEARARVRKHGTVAYIADVQDVNRHALSS